MHSMGGVIDMQRFSGLRRVLPRTHVLFLCGAAALAGVPLLSGFWSKDEILASAFQAAQHSVAGWVYTVLFVVGMLTAGLTAFYTFRAYFLTFWGEERVPHEAGAHPHEAPLVMNAPCAVLALGAVALGGVLGPSHLFEGFLELHWLHDWVHGEGGTPLGSGDKLLLMLASSAVALGGIALAWWMYVRRPALPAELARAMPAAYQASRNRFYIDELYDALIVKPLAGLAQFLRALDAHVVDGLVDLVGQIMRFVGFLVRPVQNGLVQFYALLMALGVGGFLLSSLLR
jgi:NADH-quinone oxidoreductase subunit L